MRSCGPHPLKGMNGVSARAPEGFAGRASTPAPVQEMKKLKATTMYTGIIRETAPAAGTAAKKVIRIGRRIGLTVTITVGRDDPAAGIEPGTPVFFDPVAGVIKRMIAR